MPSATSTALPQTAAPVPGLSTFDADANWRLGLALQRSHILRRPEEYLAKARRRALWTAAAALAPLAVCLAALAIGRPLVPTLALLPLALLAPAAGFAAYGAATVVPHVRAVLRARQIDAKLPYALNFLATLAAAGATPQALFASLARQPIYGAVARESARLTRDIELLGCDVVTAMGRAGQRTSSAKWQDLLQGAITALTSGGDLRTYFRDKAEQFLLDNRHDQKRFLESLGVLAECFVTVVVAAPLFLIVILSVMTSLGGSVSQTVVVGYTLVLVVLPVAQAGFILTIRTMTPEA
jgi:flagellar protein FlaJ